MQASNKTNKKIVVISAIGILNLALISVVVYLLLFRPQRIELPTDMATQATYQLYVPSNLPKGYAYDNDSPYFSEGVFGYTVTGPNSEKIFITQQARPKDFDFEQFYLSHFFKRYEQLTEAGKTTFGEINFRSKVFSIEAGDTWIFANGDLSLSNQAMEDVARSLKRY